MYITCPWWEKLIPIGCLLQDFWTISRMSWSHGGVWDGVDRGGSGITTQPHCRWNCSGLFGWKYMKNMPWSKLSNSSQPSYPWKTLKNLEGKRNFPPGKDHITPTVALLSRWFSSCLVGYGLVPWSASQRLDVETPCQFTWTRSKRHPFGSWKTLRGSDLCIHAGCYQEAQVQNISIKNCDSKC